MRRVFMAIGLMGALVLCSTANAREIDYLTAVRKATHAARVAGKQQFKTSQETTMPAYRFARPSYRTRLISVSTPSGKPARVKLYTEVHADSRDSRGRIRVIGAVLDVSVYKNGATRSKPAWVNDGYLAKDALKY
jgi:hypothetical protein